MPNLTVRASATALPISQLFRDPVLRRIFAAAERDLGAAPAIVEHGPRPRVDGDAIRVLELAEV